MTDVARRLAIPSTDDCSVPRLRFMLREGEGIIGREMSSDEWQRLGAGRTDGASDG